MSQGAGQIRVAGGSNIPNPRKGPRIMSKKLISLSLLAAVMASGMGSVAKAQGHGNRGCTVRPPQPHYGSHYNSYRPPVYVAPRYIPPVPRYPANYYSNYGGFSSGYSGFYGNVPFGGSYGNTGCNSGYGFGSNYGSNYGSNFGSGSGFSVWYSR